MQRSFQDSARNGYKLYTRTRQTASKESYTRAKEIISSHIGMHPMIVAKTGRAEVDLQTLLRSISKFRPVEVILFLSDNV
jgi:ATP-dependent RNA helicase DDX54/DBP10